MSSRRYRHHLEIIISAIKSQYDPNGYIIKNRYLTKNLQRDLHKA